MGLVFHNRLGLSFYLKKVISKYLFFTQLPNSIDNQQKNTYYLLEYRISKELMNCLVGTIYVKRVRKVGKLPIKQKKPFLQDSYRDWKSFSLVYF